jgi:preprotein translocase subunit SecG
MLEYIGVIKYLHVISLGGVTMHTFLVILLILDSALLLTVVLLQPSKTDGFKGFITGNSETFFSRNKSRTKEALLAKLTIFSAAVFALLLIVMNKIS